MVLLFDTAAWTGWPMMEWRMLEPLVVDDMAFSLTEAVPSGQYRTVFVASDFGHQPNIEIANLTVDNDPPVADAGGDMDEVVNTLVELNASQSSDNGWIDSYVWEFDDNGTPVTLMGEVVMYTFTLTGSYPVNLTVADGAGHEDTAMIWINVTEDLPPTADAGEDFDVDEGALATLDGSGSWDDVEVLNYTWMVVDHSEYMYGVAPTYTADA